MPENIDVSEKLGRQTRDALSEATKNSNRSILENELKNADPTAHRELRRVIDETFQQDLGSVLPQVHITDEPVNFTVKFTTGETMVWSFDHSGNKIQLVPHEAVHTLQAR